MEQTSKTHLIIGTIVVVAIVGLVMWFSLQTQEQSATLPPSAIQTGQPAAVQENSENIVISAKDSSDAALNQDLANIDKHMNGLDKESSAVAEGLSTPAAPQQ